MDFLPLSNSRNQRLQYTSSFIVPEQNTSNQLNKRHFQQSIHNQSNSILNENNIHLNQSHNSIVASEKDLPLIKVHQDIDEYINRRTINLNKKSSISQQSDKISSQIQQHKSIVLQSHVQNINLDRLKNASGSILRQPKGQLEISHHQYNSNIEHDLLPFDLSRDNHLPQIHQAAQRPTNKTIQQSSVNIILQNNQNHRPVEQVSQLKSIPELLNTHSNKRRSKIFQETRNVQLSRLDQTVIINQPKEQIRNSFIVQDIPFEQFHFQECKRSNLKRNILRTSNQSQIPLKLEQQSRLKSVQQQILIQTVPQEDSLITNSKLKFKRAMEPKRPIQPLEITFNQDQSQHLQNNKSKLNIERSLIAPQKPPPIHISLQQSSHLHESLNNTSKISQKRNLSASKVQQPQPVNIVPALDQHQFLSGSKILLERNLSTKALADSIHIELQSVKSEHLEEKVSPIYLKRNIIQKQEQSFYYCQAQQIIDPEIQKPSCLDQSIHLSEKSQKFEKPKPLVLQKRQLRPIQNIMNQNEIDYNNPNANENQQLDLNEMSHQVIKTESSPFIQQPLNRLQPVNLYLDNSQQQNINPTHKNLLKRNLRAELTASLNDTGIEQGWNPTKKIFNLFKMNEVENKSQPISFIKKRINTALMH